MASSSQVEDVSSHLWLRGGRTTASVIIISVRARTAKDWTGLIVPSLVSLVLLFILLLLLEVPQTRSTQALCLLCQQSPGPR